jgi:hypothetical protein
MRSRADDKESAISCSEHGLCAMLHGTLDALIPWGSQI